MLVKMLTFRILFVYPGMVLTDSIILIADQSIGLSDVVHVPMAERDLSNVLAKLQGGGKEVKSHYTVGTRTTKLTKLKWRQM